jgi:hypothetical protein
LKLFFGLIALPAESRGTRLRWHSQSAQVIPTKIMSSAMTPTACADEDSVMAMVI